MEDFDIIVVGGGHAGVEAAYAASKMGFNVGLFTINLDTIGRMPCSPSIGGLGKSHLVKEIDALGGLMAEVADSTAIQYRILNTKKGPAVRATRTQNDRRLYEMTIKSRLEMQEGIFLRQSRVDKIVVKDGKVRGILDNTGTFYKTKVAIITAGTFLSGTIHVGEKRIPAGRAGEEGAYKLSRSLKLLSLTTGRHKTGTPPRLNKETIELAELKRQDPDEDYMPLGFSSSISSLPQIPCYITQTSSLTHTLIRDNITSSPLYSGAITGKPARYCPSLEDKVMRFGDRGGHQVIIEPEGLNTKEVYASGLGNSMPIELQWEIVRSVPGLEKAEIMRPAYAIEYDYVHPTQLRATLQTKRIQGLYLAGQVNGTSGYEEAAAQGIMAGINAALQLKSAKPFVLDRSQAYIGVMIDDLTTKGTSEPYRIFTSRAEYRLMLRETNAVFRLSKYAARLGLISKKRYNNIKEIQNQIESTKSYISRTYIVIPRDIQRMRTRYTNQDTQASEKITIERFLKRPSAKGGQIQDLIKNKLIQKIHPLAAFEVEVETKYEGYIKRQQRQIKRFKDLEGFVLPQDIDYNNIAGLSNELKDRLNKIRPKTLGQASCIEGMTPAGLQAIQIGIKFSTP
ncbi:MAG: tRNA uridine-5-carboxymethylaminomethyl(34) synthesis enzyme MnmG [Deltaproteobacteria bacterium]|nr:tRNA uridine-5-carboxymethylaminomethyl(34) synthesis enzyme MnmG [Deltaproteobacteria bacterium]